MNQAGKKLAQCHKFSIFACAWPLGLENKENDVKIFN
jgi:hypothetical protein